MGGGTDSTRVCPACRSIVARAKPHCPDCGFEFPKLVREVQLDLNASTLPVLSLPGLPATGPAPAQQPAAWRAVTSASLSRHEKAEGLPSMMVSYTTDGGDVREWICFEHTDYPRQKAEAWWRRAKPGAPVPATVDDALAETGDPNLPVEIRVKLDGGYFKVVDHRFAQAKLEAAG